MSPLHDHTLDGHRTAERRSLAYHRRVAEHLAQRPQLRHKALEKVTRLLDLAPTTASNTHYATGWKKLLEGPLDELIAFLTDDSQTARDYRQSSPFAGALDPKERWNLWRDTR